MTMNIEGPAAILKKNRPGARRHEGPASSQADGDYSASLKDDVTPANSGKSLLRTRVDGHNSEYRSTRGYIPSSLRNKIFLIFKQHGHLAARDDKHVGNFTRQKRFSVMLGFFADLRKLKFKLQDPYNLKEKHVFAYARHLEEQGQASATIANKLSIIRIFAEWMGKNGMVKDADRYVRNKLSVARNSVVQEDKSWEGKNVDVMGMIAKVRELDEGVALTLELNFAFGLRVQEAVMLRPNTDHHGDFLKVRDGTKGDRPRDIPITTDVQRDVISRAKEAADGKTDYLGKRGLTVKQKIRRFYYVLERAGVTLAENNVSAHGLRHQYMHDSFRELTGIEPPIRGGDISSIPPMIFRQVSRMLVERAGHSDPTKGAAYYGSRRRKKPAAKADIKPV